ncbi:MAG: flippase-like domain-containing protein, partial [candidate division KSB1 bacterium]|nr:flippase-like domain-containing protein [candidate division KSB1 bacterium]
MKRKRHVKPVFSTILKALVSVGLVYSLLRRLGAEDVLGRLAAASLHWLLAAFAVYALSNVLGTYQWHLLLRSQQTEITFMQSLRLYHIGLFFNNFLVSNIGGDAVRIYDIKRHSGRGTVAVSTVLFDRIIGFTAMAMIAMMAAVVKARVLTRAEFWAIGAVLFLWTAILAGLFSRRVGAWLQIRLQRRLP